MIDFLKGEIIILLYWISFVTETFHLPTPKRNSFCLYDVSTILNKKQLLNVKYY